MKYIKPEIEIVEFDVENIITASGLIEGGIMDGDGDGEYHIPERVTYSVFR